MGNDLIADSELAKFLQAPGWDLCPNFPRWILVKTPSQKQAHNFINRFGELLSDWAETITVYVNYGQKLIPIIPMTNTISAPSPNLQLGGQPKMTLSLLRACEEILTYPERSMGIVRLRDNHQIGVSGGADGNFMIAGNTVEECTQWRREEYWDLSDLGRFLRESRQSMEPGSQQWFEFTYMAKARPDSSQLFRFTSRYRLIFDGLEYYHLGENLAISAI